MFDMKSNSEVLDMCKQTVKELSEFHSSIMKYLPYLKGFVVEGIIPPENMAGSLDFFFAMDRDVEDLSELICDYINSVECIEEKNSFTSRIVLLNQKFISNLRERQSLSKRKYSDIGKVILHTMDIVDFWCKQKWLGETAHGLEGSKYFFERRYENLMCLLYRLIKCLEVYLSEVEKLEFKSEKKRIDKKIAEMEN